MTNEYKVKFGDIWKMGKHRLLCGDSTEVLMMEKFLGDANPKLCVTDPPYGIHYKASVSSRELYELKVKNDHLVNWAQAFKRSRAPVLYVWFSFKVFDLSSRAITDAGYDVKQMIVWMKNHFSLQRTLYHLQHEQCMVAIKHGADNHKLWTGDRKQRSVWQVDSVPPSRRIHPTEKPVGVYTIPILNHTVPGETVIDMFAGSGVLFEACEKTKRVGIGVELCPEVCARIIKRMDDLGLPIELERNLFEQSPTKKKKSQSNSRSLSSDF